MVSLVHDIGQMLDDVGELRMGLTVVEDEENPCACIHPGSQLIDSLGLQPAANYPN